MTKRGRRKWFTEGPFGFWYRIVKHGKGNTSIQIEPKAEEKLINEGYDTSRLSQIHHRSAWQVLKAMFRVDRT